MSRLTFINCIIFAPATLMLNGCICPPCQCTVTGGTMGGDGATNAANTGNGAAVSPTGDRHVLWDGDGNGDSAKGWADCDKKPGCKATLAPAPGKGVDDSTALHFHAEGPGWLGMGW